MAYPRRLHWQSTLVSLLVLPFAGVTVLQFACIFALRSPAVAVWILGVNLALGLLAWIARAGSPAAALAGAITSASLMFSTAPDPFSLWHSALTPVLGFLLATSLATRYGRTRKEALGTAEKRHGRVAAQVCANMGFAALVAIPAVRIWLADSVPHGRLTSSTGIIIALAALSEAAADTISSEIGQVLGGTPILLTTLRRVPSGTDGAISIAGSVAGIVAAGFVAAAGAWALSIDTRNALLAWSGGVFGLFFDSLLGATLERKGWLNNDAVNFLSTVSAAAIPFAVLYSTT